jgi:hypothetical protein
MIFSENRYPLFGIMLAVERSALRRVCQESSSSDKVMKIKPPSMMVAMRNAASWPFHIFDCHMAKYSPATTMKPKNHRPKPSAKPATAHALARLKAGAGVRAASSHRVRDNKLMNGTIEIDN